ncbi:MAG: TonB-dependent receptor [Thermoanaerobaculia bacterium]
MADRSTRWYLVAFALALVLVVFGGPVFAQETTEDVEEAAEEGDTLAAEEAAILDEIVVTAQKREQNIQEVPISITSMNREEIDLLTVSAIDVRFLSGRVPSLLIESSFGRAFPRFYIRGLGNTDFDLNASQPVSMVYDEVVLENPVVKGMPVWDVERIEVLRGPQGTLFGRNTPAGIVKFDSVKPSQDFESFVRASYGTFDSIDVKGAVGGRLSDTFSARFSGLYQGRSDWVDNDFTGEKNALGSNETVAYRLQFLWEPNDRFDGLINLHGWSVDGTARLFRANIFNKGSNSVVDSFSRDKVAYDGLNDQQIDSFGGMMKLSYEFDFATLTSVTGYESLDMYSRGDIDGGFGAVFAPPSGPGFIPFPSESADGLPYLDQFTQEFRLASNSDQRLSWLGGLYFFNEDLQADTFSYNTLGGNEQDGYSFQKQTSDSWAAFGSLDYMATDRLSLQGGLRYSKDKKDFSAERPDPTFQTPTVAPITEKTDSDFTSWDLTANYMVGPTVNVYGRLATSYRAPSIQGRILFCADFEGGLNPDTNCVDVADQEEIFSGEVGVKTELLDRTLRLNLAAYTFQLDGQQIVAVGGVTNTATLLNADKTDGYGFEADIDWAPNQSWLATFGLSYNSTELKDDNLTVAACGGGCTITDPIDADGSVIVNGNSLPHAPEWIFNGIIDYRKPLGNNLFLAALDWAYNSEKRFFLYESEEFKSDFFELGVRVGYTFSQAKYEVALFGRNILDEVIVNNGIDFNNLTGMVNEPRIWGLEFVARF